MTEMTQEEVIRALEKQYRIPRKRAEDLFARRFPSGQPATAALPTEPAPPPLPVGLPFALTIPWSHLVSDNDKYGVMNRGERGQMILTREYRAAKEKIRTLARNQIGTREPLNQPLALRSLVWVPDDIRAHDVPNFAKLVHDALEKVVYVKDRWLWDTHWIRCGVDVDRPRADIRIVPFLGAAIAGFAG